MAGDFYDRFGGAIEGAIRTVVRSRRIPAFDADDFAATCRLYVLQKAAIILEGYRADARPETFFFRIFTNLYLDGRRSIAGHWRPSAAARRIGSFAIQFERLISAKGYTVAAALDAQRAAGATQATIVQLEELAAVLVAKSSRRSFPLPTDTAPDPETLLIGDEVGGQTASLQRALWSKLTELAPRDASILVAKYCHGASAKEIAALRQMTTGQVYDRLAAGKAQLRASLVAAGFGREIVVRILEHGSAGHEQNAPDWREFSRQPVAPLRESARALARTVTPADAGPRKSAPAVAPIASRGVHKARAR